MMKHNRNLLSIAMASIILVSLCAVVSTTSVSAVPSSANATTSKPSSVNVSTSQSNSATVQSGLVGAPAGIVGAPAVTSQAANSYDLVIRGTDNVVWWRHWQLGAGWSAWKSLGGTLTDSPAAVSTSLGNLQVFFRGAEGSIYTKSSTDGGTTWSANWGNLGEKTLDGTGPAAVYDGETHSIKYFVTGTNYQLYMWDESWKPSWGRELTSSPAAAYSSGGRTQLQIGVRGGDGTFWYMGRQNGVWLAWAQGNGKLLYYTSPAVVFTGRDVFGGEAARFFITGRDHKLYEVYKSFERSPEPLGGYLISSPSAASYATDHINIYAFGSDSDIWAKHTANGGDIWSIWFELSKTPPFS